MTIMDIEYNDKIEKIIYDLELVLEMLIFRDTVKNEDSFTIIKILEYHIESLRKLKYILAIKERGN